MITFAHIVDLQTWLFVVGTAADSVFFFSFGMTPMDVEQAYNGAWYVKGYAPSKPEPTIEEQVIKMEAETGLTRVMRELVLAENSGASEYVKAKAQEIEALATELRK